MRYVRVILWTLAFLWVLTPLCAAGDFIWWEDLWKNEDRFFLYLLLGALLALAWLIRTVWTVLAMMRLLPRRAEWEALGALGLEAALVAGGLGLCATNIPIHLRLTVSEPALNVIVQGYGGATLAGLCGFGSVTYHPYSDSIWLETGAGALIYSPSGEPFSVVYWADFTHLRGPWYRMVSRPM